MRKYKPSIYSKSIYTIDYKKLKKSGIKCLLFDLDNTLVESKAKIPTKQVIELFTELKKMGFLIIIFSNSNAKRLMPFSKKLDVAFNSFSLKPLRHSFIKVMKKYKLSKEEVVLIGDQLLTDVLGGNKVGIKTILVDPILTSEFFFTKINRMREKIIYNKLEKLNILKKGEYYG